MQKSDIDLTGVKSRYQQGWIPFCILWEKIVSFPFPASRDCPHSLAQRPLPLPSKLALLHLSVPYFCGYIFFDPDPSISLFHFKHPCDCTGLTQINKNNLPILRSAATLTPFLLCSITFLQDHIFVEALFCSPQKGLEKSYLCLNSSLGPENSCLALILPFLLLFNKILEVLATVIK